MMKINNYKAYRPVLRDEFKYACGYCGNREPELGGSESFHVDHYRPKSKFPHLTCNLANLIYACKYCNRNKGNYWPNFLGWCLHRIILNPRMDNLENHINQSGFAYLGLTAKGRWTVQKLKLDSPAFVKRRKRRFDMESAIRRLEDIHSQLQNGLNNAKLQNTEEAIINEFKRDIAEIVKEITAIRQNIEGRMD